MEKEERWQWNVALPKSVYERMKELARINHVSMPDITLAAFRLYLGDAERDLYTNEDEISLAINDLRERVERLERCKR